MALQTKCCSTTAQSPCLRNECDISLHNSKCLQGKRKKLSSFASSASKHVWTQWCSEAFTALCHTCRRCWCRLSCYTQSMARECVPPHTPAPIAGLAHLHWGAEGKAAQLPGTQWLCVLLQPWSSLRGESQLLCFWQGYVCEQTYIHF